MDLQGYRAWQMRQKLEGKEVKEDKDIVKSILQKHQGEVKMEEIVDDFANRTPFERSDRDVVAGIVSQAVKELEEEGKAVHVSTGYWQDK